MAQPAYTVSTLAGQNTPPGYVDGAAAVARFSTPTGVAVDRGGNIFVADSYNHVIRKITPEGAVSTFAGSAGNLGETDGTGASARFNTPFQLSFDADGNLLVTESHYYGRVRRISPAGVVTTIAGTSDGWRDGPAQLAGFDQPQGLAVDGIGNIFVADGSYSGSGYALREISPSGFVTTIAGTFGGAGASGSVDGSGEVARFNRPLGLALDAAGNLYIADAGNHTIRKRTPSGVVSTYAGIAGSAGSTDGASTSAQFNNPQAVVVDAGGNVYVADAGNNSIRRIAASSGAIGGAVTTIAGLPTAYGGDDGVGNTARFQWPAGLAIDGAGNIIVADTANNAIRRVTPAGVVSTIAGRATIGSNDGTADTARFTALANVAVDPNGDVFVTDRGTNTLRKITTAGVVTTVAGKGGFPGSADGTGSDARFREPGGVALDGAGNIYVADTANETVRKVTPAGAVTTLAGEPRVAGFSNGTGPAAHFRVPNGVAVDAAGNVYVTDIGNFRICKITPSGLVTTLAGGHGLGLADGPGASAQFYHPLDLAIARDGNLYVLDYNTRVRRITPAGDVTTIVGGSGIVGTSDGPLAQALLGHAAGLGIDAAGNLFLTDGNTIREITTTGNLVTLAGHFRAQGYQDGVGGFARFLNPTGIAADAAGNLYVADTANFVVRKGTVTPAAVAPPILSTFTSQTLKQVAGDRVTLRAGVAGSEPITYQWYRDGTLIPGATSATLVLPAVTSADEGTYSIGVTNAVGAESVILATLSVYTPALTSMTIRRSVTGGSFLWGIAEGNGRIVAVGSGGMILTSTNGIDWTRQDSGTTDWLVGVTFGAGRFVAVGANGRILTSNDAIRWLGVAASGTTQRLNNVLYAAGRFIAVGEAGTIVTSTDAATWTPVSSGVTGWLRGLAYSEKEGYFAVSGQNGAFRTSADGLTWKAEPQMPLTEDLEATVPVTSHATFVSIGQDGLAVSANRYFFTEWYQPGSRFYQWSWERGTAGINVRLRGVAQGSDAIFATGENGVVLTAPDISGPWARLATGTTANLVGGAFVGNTLFVVGENETILQSQPLYSSRLIDIATRGQVAAGDPMISGFVVTGSGPKRVLIRAAGPALTSFEVNGALAAPQLTVFDNGHNVVASNSGWTTAPNSADVATAVAGAGAFPFDAGSGDSAVLLTLQPGAYTAQVTTNAGSGVALVEAYDVDPPAGGGSRAVNISTRGFAGGGDNKLIAGFVIGGAASRRVLIRAVGPSLISYGITSALNNPQLQLYNAHGTLQQTVGSWSSQISAGEIRSAGTITGAFPLKEGSNDAAMVTTLAPGAWTVQVAGLNNTSGTVLLEVYDLP